MDEYKEGELIIYKNGDSYEIGKIKRLTPSGAYVWYSEGETAAETGGRKHEKGPRLEVGALRHPCQKAEDPEEVPEKAPWILCASYSTWRQG